MEEENIDLKAFGFEEELEAESEPKAAEPKPKTKNYTSVKRAEIFKGYNQLVESKDIVPVPQFEEYEPEHNSNFGCITYNFEYLNNPDYPFYAKQIVDTFKELIDNKEFAVKKISINLRYDVDDALKNRKFDVEAIAKDEFLQNYSENSGYEKRTSSQSKDMVSLGTLYTKASGTMNAEHNKKTWENIYSKITAADMYDDTSGIWEKGGSRMDRLNFVVITYKNSGESQGKGFKETTTRTKKIFIINRDIHKELSLKHGVTIHPNSLTDISQKKGSTICGQVCLAYYFRAYGFNIKEYLENINNPDYVPKINQTFNDSDVENKGVPSNNMSSWRESGKEMAYNNALTCVTKLIDHHGAMDLEDFNKVTNLFPVFTIRIFKIIESNRTLVFECGKSDYPRYINLLLHESHYYVIRSLKSFMNNEFSSNLFFCNTCITTFKNITAKINHKCGANCQKCGYEYISEEDKTIHNTTILAHEANRCIKCNFAYEKHGCLQKHTCNKWKCWGCLGICSFEHSANHICGEKLCLKCYTYYDPKNHHLCYVNTSEMPKIPDVVGKTRQPMYAFDFEATSTKVRDIDPVSVIPKSTSSFAAKYYVKKLDNIMREYKLTLKKASKQIIKYFNGYGWNTSLTELSEYSVYEKFKTLDNAINLQQCEVFENFIINAIDLEDMIDEEWAINAQKKFINLKNKFNDLNEIIFNNVTLICVKKLYTHERMTFNSLKDFADWFLLIKKHSIFFAHNGGRYDNYILKQYLIHERLIIPKKIITAGKRIITMIVQECEFNDSMNHINKSLSATGETFNLKEQKGSFPYSFYTINTIDYVGDIPDIKYFERAKLKSEKQIEFDLWYNTWIDLNKNGVLYDIKKECEKYCMMDVDILCTCLEKYRDSCIELNQLDPLVSITIASYAMRVYRTSHLPPKTIGMLDREMYDFVDKSFIGGRTECRQMYRVWTPEDIANGIYGVYVDIVSMYPTVQMYDLLPYGEAVWIDSTILKRLNKALMCHKWLSSLKRDSKVAIVKCTVKCPDNLEHAVLLQKRDHKLIASLDITEGYFTSAELSVAVEKGYIINSIENALVSKAAVGKLFNSYIAKYIKIKNKHSPNGSEPNKGLREIAKMMLNSLWGKFAQKEDCGETKYFNKTNGIEWDKLINRYNLDEVTHINVSEATEDYIYVSITEAKSKHLKLNSTNLMLAAFVTANARLRLFKWLDILGDRVIYHDTDSIVYEYNKNLVNIPTGHALGEWEEECNRMSLWTALAAKTYAFKGLKPNTEKSIEVIKSKGFSTGFTIDQYCNYVKDFFNYLEDKRNPKAKELVQTGIIFKRGTCITIEKYVKKLAASMHKAAVISCSRTVPFGHKDEHLALFEREH
jgi:hypothetical protein